MATKRTIKKLFKKWEWLLDWLGWKWTIYYATNDTMPEESSEHCGMITYCDFGYLEANIYVNMDNMSQINDEDAERAVVHELCHPLIDPMDNGTDRKLMEYTATTVSRLLYTLDKRNE